MYILLKCDCGDELMQVKTGKPYFTDETKVRCEKCTREYKLKEEIKKFISKEG